MIIKLPNFFENNKLNALKEKMGIDRYTYGNYKDCQSLIYNIILSLL